MSEAESERDKRCDALRERLWEGRQATYEQQDKAILTLSSGALALSVSFLKDIVALPQASLLAVLLFSWAMFAAAIVSTVLSYLMSQKAHDRQITNLENYREGNEEALDDRFNPPRLWTERLNQAALVCFVLGLFTTMCFVTVNTVKSTQVPTKRVSEPDEKKGISPPSFPKPQHRPPQPPSPKPEPAKK